MDKSRLDDLLFSLERSNGSKLHLMPNRVPWYRVHDAVVTSDEPPITPTALRELTRDFLFADQRARLEAGEEVSILYSSARGVRYRTTVLRQSDGLAVQFRRLPEQIPSLADLQLPPALANFTAFRTGIVVLTGFVGSGRSTTMAALVEQLNHERAAHVITLENPIEFIHHSAVALIHQRELGKHVASIRAGIDDAHRAGADVLVVSDIKSVADLGAVLDAADRGCLVLTSFHSNGVVGCLADLIHLAPAHERHQLRQRLSLHIRGIAAQALLQRRHSAGRIALVEVMIRNRSIAQAIVDGELSRIPELMKRGRGLGMRTIDQALVDLLDDNAITVAEADLHAIDRAEVRSRMSRVSV